VQFLGGSETVMAGTWSWSRAATAGHAHFEWVEKKVLKALKRHDDGRGCARKPPALGLLFTSGIE